MTNKITLITPPDFYENSNFSVLFMGLDEEQQDVVSRWLAENPVYPDTNIYFYQGEPNIPWLLYALNRSDAKFLNYNSGYAILNLLGSYMLGKSNMFYTTSDENIKLLMLMQIMLLIIQSICYKSICYILTISSFLFSRYF